MSTSPTYAGLNVFILPENVSVIEGTSALEICVQVNGLTEIPVLVTLSTADKEAVGKQIMIF